MGGFVQEELQSLNLKTTAVNQKKKRPNPVHGIFRLVSLALR